MQESNASFPSSFLTLVASLIYDENCVHVSDALTFTLDHNYLHEERTEVSIPHFLKHSRLFKESFFSQTFGKQIHQSYLKFCGCFFLSFSNHEVMILKP